MSEMAMLNMSSFSVNLKCEPPLPLFRGSKLHSDTTSKKLVQLLHENCPSVPYKRVLHIEASFARSIAEQAKANSNIVCPSNLKQHTCIFTVAALDNLDHNPSSRTATLSFHGTGISIFQFPSLDKPGLSRERPEIDSWTRKPGTSGSILPTSYTFVPSVGRNLVSQPPVKHNAFI